MKRRSFLKQSAMTGVVAAVANQRGLGGQAARHQQAAHGRKPIVRFGICADLHQDLITDGEARLQAFISEMTRLKPDFIIQIGDFCTPKEENKPLMGIWNSFSGPRYHVIGNHDRDGGFTFDQVLQFWGAKAPYYSFDVNGYHFVVLNGNERNADEAYKGYPRSITSEQRRWMEKDIEAAKLPTIIFCHQGIDNDMDGLWEGNRLRVVFERSNRKAGFHKIRAVLSGHHHEDYCNTYNGIHYVQINSMSYQFCHTEPGYEFVHCKEPIWGVVSVYKDGSLEIKGKRSEYAGGLVRWENSERYDGYPTVPIVSTRVLTI